MEAQNMDPQNKVSSIRDVEKHDRHASQPSLPNRYAADAIDPLPNHSRLNTLQEVRLNAFAGISPWEVLAAFEAKSCGAYLWLSVAIRFLAIASNDTTRGFLGEISSAQRPSNYEAAMNILEQAIWWALTATAPVRLKSDLTVGGAAALVVIGLRSSETNKVLEETCSQLLLKYDDDANRYFFTILHPGSRQVNRSMDTSACVHVDMAYVCIDFLETRLTSGVCTHADQTKTNGESVIDPNTIPKVLEHLRLHSTSPRSMHTSSGWSI